MQQKFNDIIFEKSGGVAKITINRPEVRNAFRPETIDEMVKAFTSAWHDDDVGVVILTGAGDKAFCSGGDQRIRTKGGYADSSGKPQLQIL